MTAKDSKKRLSESLYWQAEKMAGKDDLLSEILLRLPATSLLRFKTISPHWHSLISNPHFQQLHSYMNSGLFLFRKSDKRYHLDHFVNFSENNISSVIPSEKGDMYANFTPIPTKVENFSGNMTKTDVPPDMRAFIKCFPSVEPMNYCNGLFCLKLHLDNGEIFYCVYNPCTNRYTNIPKPDNIDPDDEIISMSLAFDPSSSSNYKIVCIVRHTRSLSSEIFGFFTFSSTSTTWEKIGLLLRVRGDFYHGKGVYLNGAIHLVSKDSMFLCFDVDNESIKEMPSTSIPEEMNERKIKYFGKSAGQLHLIEEGVCRPTLLNVFELEKDYSKWFVKYVVDVDNLTRLFPLMVINKPETLDVIGYQFDVLSFIDGERDGKTMVVLSLPEKLISYYIKSRDIKDL